MVLRIDLREDGVLYADIVKIVVDKLEIYLNGKCAGSINPDSIISIETVNHPSLKEGA